MNAAQQQLPVIRLSDDFLKLLKLDATTANTLAPVFATRVERLTSSGEWATRAVILNREGTLRVFECGSGRITHAMDFAYVNAFSPIELDAPAARVRSYATVQVTIGTAGSGMASQQQSVRIVGVCKAKLSLDDRLVRHERGLGDVVSFEDDILLRFTSTPQQQLALQFAAALKFFGDAREPPSTFTMQRANTTLEDICSEKYKQSYDTAHQEQDGSGRSTGDLEGRRKPSRLAESFSIFKKEISTIQSLASHTKKEIVTSGGVLEPPPIESPRPINAVNDSTSPDRAKNTLHDDDARREGDAQVAVTGDTNDEALMRLLTQRKLSTISISTQRTQWIPRYVEDLLHRYANELVATRAVNAEQCARWMLLEHYCDELQKHRASRVDLMNSQAQWCQSALDDVVTPYTVAKLQAMHAAFASLHLPLPEFDRKAFDEALLETLYERDALEEHNDSTSMEVERCTKELQTELLEDAEEVRQEQDSAEVITRLKSLQVALKAAQQAVHDRTTVEKAQQEDVCLATLGKQAIDISRLQAHLQRLKSVYALHEELIHEVPPLPAGPSCSSMGFAGRRVRMMNDV